MPLKKSAPKKSAQPVAVKAAGAKTVTKAKPKSKAGAKSDLSPERIAEILRRLEAAYPNAECALHHRNAWELLVAPILSAQCTDARVNMVTPELFRKFPTPEAMAEASLPVIEEEIRSTGFYHNKAKSISGAAKRVVSEFGGEG